MPSYDLSGIFDEAEDAPSPQYDLSGVFDEPKEGSFLEDMGRTYMGASAGLAEAAGWGIEKLGADTFGGWLRETAKSSKESWTSGLSDEQNAANQKEFWNEDGFGDAWTDPRALASGIVGSAPGTLIGGGIGGAATKGLLGLGTRTAIARGFAASGTATGIEKAFTLVPQIGPKVAAAAGFGVGEGSVAALSSGVNTEEQVLAMPIETLEQHPEYLAAFDRLGDPDKARAAVAKAAGGDAAALNFLTTTALSAPAGLVLGKIFAGIPLNTTRGRAVGMGTALESGQEFFQSGAEQAGVNLAIRGNADPTRELGTDVLNQSFAGAAAGAPLGAAGGAMARLEPAALAQPETPGAGPDHIPADQFARPEDTDPVEGATRLLQRPYGEAAEEGATRARATVAARGGDALEQEDAASEAVSLALGAMPGRDEIENALAPQMQQLEVERAQAEEVDSDEEIVVQYRAIPETPAPATKPGAPPAQTPPPRFKRSDRAGVGGFVLDGVGYNPSAENIIVRRPDGEPTSVVADRYSKPGRMRAGETSYSDAVKSGLIPEELTGVLGRWNTGETINVADEVSGLVGKAASPAQAPESGDPGAAPSSDVAPAPLLGESTGNSPTLVRANLARSSLGEHVAALEQAGRLRVVTSADELPPEVQSALSKSEETGAPQGFLYRGSVWMVADQITPGDEAGVFLHEGKHYSLERPENAFVHARLQQQFDGLVKRADGYALKALARVQMAGTTGPKAALERLAYLTEEVVNDPQNASPPARMLVARVIQDVRAWFATSKTGKILAAAGIKVQLSPQEVVQIIRKSVLATAKKDAAAVRSGATKASTGAESASVQASRKPPPDRISKLIVNSGVASDHVRSLYAEDPLDAIATDFGLDTVREEDVAKARTYLQRESQAALREKFGETVTAYRGTTGTETRGETVSLSLSESTARFHAEQNKGAVEKVEVPVSSVLSYSEALGRGTFAEEEIIVRREDLDIQFSRKPKAPENEDQKWANWQPEVTSTGKVKGAPEWIKSKRDMPRLYKMLKDRIREGITGRYWYEESARAALTVTNGDLREAEKLIQIIAIYSPQAYVYHNTNFALSAWNQWKAGVSEAQFKVKTSEQDRKAIDVLYHDKPFEGRKTNSFYLNLMHDIVASHPEALSVLQLDTDLIAALDKPVTIDLWMYRAFGYEAEAAGNDKGTGRYSFAENVVRRITASLNARLAAGEPRWTPHQVQAAVWSAMKARYENPQVKRDTWAESFKKGFSSQDEQGRNVAPTSAHDTRKHRAIWRKLAMKVNSSVVARDAERSSASYRHYFDKFSRVITWETTPSVAVAPRLANAPAEIREAFNEEAHAVLFDRGRDVLAEKLGIRVVSLQTRFGGYKQGVNPVNLTRLHSPRLETTEVQATQYAAAVQYVMRQEAVPWFTPDETAMVSQAAREAQLFRVIGPKGTTIPGTTVPTLAEAQAIVAERGAGYSVRGGKYAEGVVIEFDRELTMADNEAFMADLVRVLGPGAGYTNVSENEVLVVNFRGEDGVPFVDDNDFARSLSGLESAVERHGIIGARDVYVESRYGHEQDWKAEPSGVSVLDKGGISGRPDLQAWLDGRRDAVGRVIDTYESLLEGLGVEPGGIQFSRAARAIGSPGADGGGTASTPRYGVAQADSVSVLGVHFSPARRAVLESDRYGTGRRGEEARRIANSSDPRLKKRIYFYIPENEGLLPEPGVGAYAHRLFLDNVYPLTQDPRGLYQPLDLNATESAILDAGFDGYSVERAFRGHNGRPTMGAAVLIGEHSVAAEDAGTRDNPQFSRKPAAPIEITETVVIAETGETVEITRDASVALRQLDKRIASAQQLVRCLA